MAGLLDTLNLASRSMQAQMLGVQVSGQNLSNVNTTGYSRQVVDIQTSPDIMTGIGPEGTGANATSIQQVVSTLLNSQIQSQQTTSGYWNAQQSALQSVQSELGEFLSGTGSTDSTSSTAGSTTDTGLSAQLDTLFNDFQNVAASPTSNSAKQQLVNDAATLASSFNQVSSQLSGVQSTLNTTVSNGVTSANQLLTGIAQLNQQIASAQISGGNANDLLDQREQDLENLSNLASVTYSTGANDAVDVSLDGGSLVSGSQVQNSLQTVTNASGNLLVGTTGSSGAVTLTGGSIQGTIDARDGSLASLQSNLDSLASNLITQVNTIHDSGQSSSGTTGQTFFTGTDASTIGVNQALVENPSLVQTAAAGGPTGDNSVALALAQLANTPLSALNNQTFTGSYAETVANLGNALQNANNEVSDQTTVSTMLQAQRSSISGVSVDQEMTNLMTYQRAYEASAQLVNTVNTMLGDTLAMMTS